MRHFGQAAFQQALNGTPTFLGVITCTTTAKSNASTATPFTIPAGALLLVETDADMYWGAGYTPTAGATGTGKKLAAGSDWFITLRGTGATLSAITSSGTANVKVFQMT